VLNVFIGAAIMFVGILLGAALIQMKSPGR